MTLIKKIATNSRNNDSNALLSLILAALAKNDWSADTFLTSVIGKVNGHNTGLTEALNRLQTYSQMAEKDHARDLEIRSLFKLVEGYTHIPVAEVKEAALVVYHVLEQYGLGIQNEDYSAESAEVNSLLNDLSKADIAAAIAKLQGVGEVVTSLTTAENEFEAIALQQAEGEGAKKDLASASKLKDAAIKEVNDNLVGYLNTMAKVNADTYLATAQTIAELIENNNALLKRRHKTKETEADAEVN
eukprot:TRINITY_DN694_c0_g1_i2.p2 TRINITY_DN694_c0_g1~~TRINITY_DN694_c0_g1_i2.p2  ORF type:complete len:245 (+),score=16.65 TRINITY_DN694_c0_g1_i2:1823-2557(+)